MMKADGPLTVGLLSTAKTFLGTFSLNRLPHGRVAFRSSTVHEIQREIIQLVSLENIVIELMQQHLHCFLFLTSTASAQRLIVSPPRLQPLTPEEEVSPASSKTFSWCLMLLFRLHGNNCRTLKM